MPATLTLTDALADELAAAVEAGVPIETAAQAVGIDSRTFYRWLQIARNGERADGAAVDPESFVIIGRFGRLVASAQARFEARKVQNVSRAAEVVNAKTGQVDWRADAWLLNNHPRYRARYRQERVVQTEHSGTVQHEHTLAERADDDQLRSWAALELPAPTAD